MTTPPDSPAPGRPVDETRLSALSEALLRVSPTLDVETVPRDAIVGPRAHAGASRRCIVTVDETGMPQDCITSDMTGELSGRHRSCVRLRAGT